MLFLRSVESRLPDTLPRKLVLNKIFYLCQDSIDIRHVVVNRHLLSRHEKRVKPLVIVAEIAGSIPGRQKDPVGMITRTLGRTGPNGYMCTSVEPD